MSDIRIEPAPIANARVWIVLLASVVIVLVLALLLTGGGRDFFEPTTYLHSYMPDASGLLVEAPVQLDGIQIGQISDVKLSGLNDPKRVVWVEMKVKTRYLPAIPVDSTISITADDLLGDKYLNISTGHRTETVTPDSELKSKLPIADQFNSADLVAALKDMLAKVDKSLKQIEDGRTPVGRFVQTEYLYDQTLNWIVTLQNTVESLAHPKSELGKMLFTDEAYQQIRAPLLAIDKTLADLQAGEGDYGHMLASSQQYDQIRKELAGIRQDIAQINAGKGALGELTQTNTAYRHIERLIKSFSDMLDSLNAGEGQLGVYLADSQLYESLTGSTTEIRQTIGDFRRNPRKYLRVKVF